MSPIAAWTARGSAESLPSARSPSTRTMLNPCSCGAWALTGGASNAHAATTIVAVLTRLIVIPLLSIELGIEDPYHPRAARRRELHLASRHHDDVLGRHSRAGRG